VATAKALLGRNDQTHHPGWNPTQWIPDHQLRGIPNHVSIYGTKQTNKKLRCGNRKRAARSKRPNTPYNIPDCLLLDTVIESKHAWSTVQKISRLRISRKSGRPRERGTTETETLPKHGQRSAMVNTRQPIDTPKQERTYHTISMSCL